MYFYPYMLIKTDKLEFKKSLFMMKHPKVPFFRNLEKKI